MQASGRRRSPNHNTSSPDRRRGRQHAHTREWSPRVAAIDGFLFVFPQYNWGYPAALKNALDFLYVEWRNKPASVFTYGTRGGGKGAQQLITVLHGLHMNVLEEHVEASLRTPTSTTSGSSPTPRPLCALPWSIFARSTPGLSKCSSTASEPLQPERP